MAEKGNNAEHQIWICPYRATVLSPFYRLIVLVRIDVLDRRLKEYDCKYCEEYSKDKVRRNDSLDHLVKSSLLCRSCEQSGLHSSHYVLVLRTDYHRSKQKRSYDAGKLVADTHYAYTFGSALMRSDDGNERISYRLQYGKGRSDDEQSGKKHCISPCQGCRPE